jgi:hypothetical protein
LKFKGYLREFRILKDGTLQLKINIWKGTFTQEQVNEIGGSSEGPDAEVELLRFSDGKRRDEWLPKTIDKKKEA